MQNNRLNKEFKEKDLQRARNLITKDFNSRTIKGIGYETQRVKHKEGDIWEEDGKTWTIKDGIRQNITKLDDLKKWVRVPLTCPKCGGSMKSRLSKKMWTIHRMCFDCVLSYEANLRKAGLYKQYEKAMMLGSLEAWVKDLQQYVDDFINSDNSYVTEEGDIEDWDHNKKQLKERVYSQLNEYVEHAKNILEENGKENNKE